MEKLQVITTNSLSSNFIIAKGKLWGNGLVDERAITNIEKVATKTNGLNVYSFTSLVDGEENLGYKAEEVINYLQSKGYDETLINKVVLRIPGIDWKTTIATFNSDENKSVKTYSELKTEHAELRKYKSISGYTLDEFIKEIDTRLAESRHIDEWERKAYNDFKKFLDISHWHVNVDDLYFINYANLNLLLE